MIYALLMTLVGWGLFALAQNEGGLAVREHISKQAFYAAEAGVENARAYLSEPGRDDWSGVPSRLYTDKELPSLPEATYTVVVSAQSANSVKITSTGTYRGKTREVEADLERGS